YLKYLIHLIKSERSHTIMAKLTQDMKEMILTQQCFHATVSTEGVPNNAPKRSTRVFDDETLIFSEGTGGTTYKNILDGSKVSVAVVNREILDGFRFLGTPEVLTSGDIYEKSAEMSLKAGMPKPKAVILIHIDEIHSLKPGPMAGKRIA
ncbi:MAG: pyridoxamine 5'-phosphate oxidase family protein, partial [Bacteroidetes bacterium]|nr:pyridoxamine 5'-phosphate oxidase family protein [Bacteroidota bacterium]